MTVPQSNPSTERTSRGNRRVAVMCAVAVVTMVGASYAAVPLYDMFCKVTGFGGTTQRAEAPSGHIIDRKIIVRFDANTARKLGWKFKPAQSQVTLKLGETASVAYIAENITKKPGWATATFNVTPDIAGVYFNKIECFCFTEQQLDAGGKTEMPVVFYVDPDLNDDPLLDHVKTITLSYTFFATDPPDARPVAAKKPAGKLPRKL